MHLYNLSLQQPTGITHAIFGNFSTPKAQEIVLARGKVLELVSTDEDTGKVHSILAWECFGNIRSVITFRLQGTHRDYIVVGSDSGRIVILQYNADKNCFDRVHKETFGKSGCRRIVPGQYLAADPKGRAVMIGATEKQKFVYVLNRDSDSNLIISSPLEAHKAQSICLDIVGVDVEYENPVFACLEIDYSELDDIEINPEDREAQKTLTFYELDLSLNHVTRKHMEVVDPGANLLVSVPGGNEGPGGVLVLAENWVIYMNEDHEEVRAPIPRRTATPDEKGILIVSVAAHKQKDMFFFLIQSELGDIYRVKLDYDGDVVNDVHVKYFDTVPPANDLCVLRVGFLFVASEFANQYLLTFQGIGDDDESPEASSQSETYVYFDPRPLKNLMLIDELSSLSPITDIKVQDLAHEDSKQIYTLCGRGPRSSLRVLRYGLAVSEMAVSEVPGNPTAVWSIKRNKSDKFDSYIIVSFTNVTLVLSIGDTVEEVSDSGFLDSSPTLGASLLGESTLMQIHAEGIRLIRADKRINEWKPPGKKKITRSATNGKQVIIAMSGGELAYFELDRYQNLNEIDRKEMRQDISCLAIAPVPEGRVKARFMVVGSFDNVARILDLENTEDMMHPLSTQVLPAAPESLLLTPQTMQDQSKLFLFAGLTNGTQVRSTINAVDGTMSDARQRFLGNMPVKLFQLHMHNRGVVLALSSRSWMNYEYQGRHLTTPLSYDMLEHACEFRSDQCPEGIVAISGKTLRILLIEKLGEVFNQTSYPLRYTPRKFEVHPITNNLLIVEADHNAYPYAQKQQLQETLKIGDEMDDVQDDKEKAELSEIFVGAPQPGAGNWGSCVRIMDASNGNTLSLLELEDNEAAFSLCTCIFGVRPDDIYLVVGTAKDLELSPRKISSGFIHVYEFVDNNTGLRLVHKTKVEDVPMALCPFQGQLLVGVGSVLRLYDFGKKKLLRKSENRELPSRIKSIHTESNRIYVGDVNAGFFFVRYISRTKKMQIFSDNMCPRYVTASILIDFETVGVADKFGNFCITRMPDKEKIEESIKHIEYGGILNSAATKLTDIVQYHVGDTITSLQKTNLYPGGSDVIIYSTVMGSIGCFKPFESREDIEFFTHLEMHMRQQAAPLLGNRHIAYRSYYYPVRCCIDGDLCEQYSSIDEKKQKHIASEMVMSPAEVQKRVETMRNMIL
eukprot:275342_1